MSLQDLQQTFFNDPRWREVEEMLLKKIEPLKDLTHDLDLTQPAEHVKAEVMARVIAYNKMADFLNEIGLVGTKLNKIKEPYR